MADKTTPEEKLLKLIENPNQPAADRHKIKLPGRKFSFNFLSFRQLKASIKQFKTAQGKFKLYAINVKLVSRGLVVIAILLAIFLVFDFIAGQPTLSNNVYAKQVGGESLAPGVIEPQSAINLTDYQSSIDKRDIFHFIPIKKEEKTVNNKDILMAEVAQLKLVGIIWSKSPQAMIEDKRENKTSLVSDGDAVGKLKVKKILKDKVVVVYENEEYDLL